MNNCSIIVPLFNEEKNIENLVEEITFHLKYLKGYEIILVNDGSTDKTKLVLENLKNKYSICYINLNKNQGQSFAIQQGIIKAKNQIIITIDGDGQNNPKDILTLLKIYNSGQKYSLIGGIRTKRKDSKLKIISSKLANKIRQFILKDDCLDTGCSLKVFDKKTFLELPFFDGIHRFLPALFKGYGRETLFVDVDHRARMFGNSKYGTLGRAVRGVRDLIKVVKIIKKFKRNNA
tara:strand:+ start:288 stop:989 length:702 start_codon:yes stop_codon:yes gene_type:complete